MSQTLVRKVALPQTTEAPRLVWYLNNLKCPLLYEGRIIDWQYCDAAYCGNDGASGCHGCSNWRESPSYSR